MKKNETYTKEQLESANNIAAFTSKIPNKKQNTAVLVMNAFLDGFNAAYEVMEEKQS
jgi:hypothetical protein